MNNLMFAAFLLLAALNAWGEEGKPDPACRREADGRVSCTADGFKTLTDMVLEHRAGEEKWLMRHGACVTSREAAEGALGACEGQRQAAEAKLAAIKPPSVLRPVLAVTAAVLGAVALTSALTLDVPAEVRLGLGAGGLVGVAAGFVFVIPERQEK